MSLPRRDLLLITSLAVLGLHLALRLLAIPDYQVTVDSAYHVTLARQYAEHGVYFWDDVHYAPAHRPNLQGPALHVAIALLGTALGGAGDDLILANALLAVAGWLAAMGTALYFAQRFGGGRAGLFAVAVLSGTAYASGSLGANMPSGWIFLLTPWAIWAFVQRRLVLATLCTALVCYVHLGGFATAPAGVFFAALFTRRPKDLIVVGLGVAALTAPYLIHFARSLDWYVGVKSETSWMVDPLVALVWIVGVAALIRGRGAPGRAFLAAWAAAPAAWLIQDASRFVMQSSLAGAAIGGIAIAGWVEGRGPGARRALTAGLVIVATFAPLGLPGLAVEGLWLARHTPRMLDWAELRVDAAALGEVELGDRLVQGFDGYVVSGMAIWQDFPGEKGHWVEVRPPEDPADDMGVAEKVYVLPIRQDDPQLRAWADDGLIEVFGGGAWSSVIAFTRALPLDDARRERDRVWGESADWLASRCENNAIGDAMAVMFDPEELPRRRGVRGACRQRVVRMQIALMMYAWALEPVDPDAAWAARRQARSLHWFQALVGDESNIGFRSDAEFEAMQADMRALSDAVASGQGVEAAFAAAVEGFLSVGGGSFGETTNPGL